MMDIKYKKYTYIFSAIYVLLFISGIRTLFHGFPDIERFFAEWQDERIVMTVIIKFGTLNFAPTQIIHPPLYYYLTFIPIAVFFVIGKLTGFFHDKVDFVRFYFNNTHYFFFIGRIMSYVFYWLTAVIIFKIARLFYTRIIAHLTVLSYLLVPHFIFDFSAGRPETLLFLGAALFFYFFLRYYLSSQRVFSSAAHPEARRAEGSQQIRHLFLSSFLLGASIATKYNAVYLTFLFIFLFFLQVINKTINFRRFMFLCGIACCFIFLGFFVCNPFFIIKFNTYFHNLLEFSNISGNFKYVLKETNPTSKIYYPAVFCITHIKNLVSLMYLNLFGFLIVLFGAWSLFKKDKKLFIIVTSIVLVYEVYFGIVQRYCSPLRYLNPLFPVAALVFAAGVDFIVSHKKKMMAILVIFAGISAYNYFDIWKALSFGKTYIQEARAFIEKNIPEFTTICIIPTNFLPQLNMTRESYYHLMKAIPSEAANIKSDQITFDYRQMEDENNYDNSFREFRIQSLMKKPQYNIIKWDGNIKTRNAAEIFIRKNNIKYIITGGSCTVDLEDEKIATLLKEFKPKNNRVFEGHPVFLYKVD